MKKIMKKFIPPIFFDIKNKLFHSKNGWKGTYETWQAAEKASTGYDTDKILTKVKASLLKVKHGEAVYERDSVIFDEIQYSWPLLAGLMLAASRFPQGLRILDFGGSLGSTYFQNKKFIDKLRNVSWNIVEQKHFVTAGKKDFEDETLAFYYDFQTCIESVKPNVLLLSSVLQYIEKPYTLLDEILKYKFDYIIIDRSPFSTSKADEIKLQIVPSYIYTASYPCWFFDEYFMINYFKSKKYEVIETFEALDGRSDEYNFKGFILSHA
jgi:putative methyltransferase (TIGR04325 family)